jgi:hypothetical protein
MKATSQLEDVDIVGIGVNFDFTAAMGGGTSVEGVYFLDGKDRGTSEVYKSHRQNIGLDGGLGIYALEGDYSDDKSLTRKDYKGRSFSVGGDIGGASINYFWAPKEGVSDGTGMKSLFNRDLRAWTGYNVGVGAGGGFQISKQDTEVYKK